MHDQKCPACNKVPQWSSFRIIDSFLFLAHEYFSSLFATLIYFEGLTGDEVGILVRVDRV